MMLLRTALPYKSPPSLLSIQSVQRWVAPGRYLNYNGYSIFYRDGIGDMRYNKSEPALVSQLPIVVFLHGFPTFSIDFATLYREVSSAGYHAVNLDFLGFGVSDKPTDIDYSLHMQADIVEAVLGSVVAERDQLNGAPSRSLRTPIKIIAHDMGDSVAQELLARWMDENAPFKYDITSVVLLNGGLFPETHRPRAAQLLLLSKATGPVASRFFTFSLFSHSFNEVFGPHSKLNIDEMGLYWQSLLYKGGSSCMHLLQQYMTDRVQHRERWVGALINASSLIHIRLINGPFDPVSGKHMVRRYQQLVPAEGQDVVVLGESIGHYPQLEDPATVRQHVLSFLQKASHTS